MSQLERTEKNVTVLLSEWRNRDYGIPEIQRDYVWNRPQARDLVESMYKQYPCGLMLFWKPPETAPYLRDFATAAEQTGPESKIPVLLVLDGQQRLTALLKVFNNEIPVYFNVQDESFQLYNPTMRGTKEWVPVFDVISKGAVAVWLGLRTDNEADFSEEHLQRLSTLEKIKDYTFPIAIFHTDDFEAATDSFVRLNKKGTRLREAELALARLAFKWPGAVTETITQALEAYERAGFDFDTRFVMRCMVAVGTGQSRFKHLTVLWQKSEEDLKAIWIQTKRGLDATVNFLRGNVGIESADWLPSANALVPLIYFFAQRGTKPISAKEGRHLLLWFLKASMWSRFSTSPETVMDKDLKAVSVGVDELLSLLNRDTKEAVVSPDDLGGKYGSSSFLPVVFAIVRSNRAQDWGTGIEISSTSVGPVHQIECHHIFPRAFLRRAGDFTPTQVDDLSNIAFLCKGANDSISDSDPMQYLPAIEPNRLEEQFIPLERELWTPEHYEDFLAARREMLAAAINSYLEKLA